MLPGYSRDVKAIWLQVPADFLERRRRLGHDRHDEVWEGVLHMVPSPTVWHQRIETELLVALNDIATRRGLLALPQIDLHDPVSEGYSDYRQPDIVLVDRVNTSARGIEGAAALAVEIISPHDESRDKVSFYARVGVRELWLVDPRERTIEVFRGTMPVPAHNRTISAPSLGLELRLEGSDLVIRDGSETYTVDMRDVV
jgi:Uma2 family endonuclease